MAIPIRRSSVRVSGRVAWIAALRFTVIVSVLFMMFAPFLFISGCSSMNETVNVYTEKASTIIDDINKKLSELKEGWMLPLKDQTNLKGVQKDYGKAVDKAQSLIDHVDAPKVCRDLETQVSVIEEKAKSIGRMTTPFSDYASDMSSIAVEIDDLISELEVFEKKKDLQTGARQMYDKANSIYSKVKSEVPPPLFQGIQAEFVDFMAGFTDKFYKAAERASAWTNEEQTEFAEDGESEEENEEPEDNYRNSALKPILEDVPDEWDQFNNRLNEWMDAAREVGGLNAAYVEMEQLISQAVSEIKKLQKKYPL